MSIKPKQSSNDLFNELTDKSNMSANDYLSIQLNKFLSEDYNTKLEELLNSLKLYKQSIEASINKSESVKNEDFKHTLYASLESLLYQTSYLKSKECRESKINSIHQWFIEKQGLFTFLPPPIKEPPKKVDTIKLPDLSVDFKLDQLLKEQKKKILLNKINSNSSFIKSRNDNDGLSHYHHSMDHNIIKSSDNDSCNYTKKNPRKIMLKPLLNYEILKLDNQLENQRKRNLTNIRTIGELSHRTNNITMVRAMKKGKFVNKSEKQKLVRFYKRMILDHKDKELAETKEKERIARNEKFFLTTRNNIIEKRKKYSFHITRNKQVNQSTKSLGTNWNQVPESKSVLITQTSNIIQSNRIQEIEIPHIPKVSIDNPRMIKESNSQRIISINTKITPAFIKKSILHNMKFKNEPIPDTCYTNLQFQDPIFLTRTLLKDTIDVNEIDNSKKNIYNSNPLSLFSLENINVNSKIKDNENKTMILSHSKDKIEFAKNNYPMLKENLLQLRQSMSSLNKNELKALKSKRKNLDVNNSVMCAFINPSEDLLPVSYLPRNGSGLLFLLKNNH